MPARLRWARAVAHAMRAMHELGLMHHDIKLSNVMPTAERQVKVRAWGNACSPAYITAASHGRLPQSSLYVFH